MRPLLLAIPLLLLGAGAAAAEPARAPERDSTDGRAVARVQRSESVLFEDSRGVAPGAHEALLFALGLIGLGAGLSRPPHP